MTDNPTHKPGDEISGALDIERAHLADEFGAPTWDDYDERQAQIKARTTAVEAVLAWYGSDYGPESEDIAEVIADADMITQYILTGTKPEPDDEVATDEATQTVTGTGQPAAHIGGVFAGIKHRLKDVVD